MEGDYDFESRNRTKVVKSLATTNPLTWNLTQYPRSFRIPVDSEMNAWTHPVILTSPTASTVRASAALVGTFPVTGAGVVSSLATVGPKQLLNGATLEYQRTGSILGSPGPGASPLQLCGAAGGGLYRRFFDMQIQSNNAGLVVCSDGMGSYQVAAGPPGVVFHFGPNGIRQTTANTAITATLAGATLFANIVMDAGSDS